MISIKSDREIELMREAGKLNYLTHEEVKKHLKVGVTSKELDKVAYNFIVSHNAKPSFLNYEGFPASICVSVNDEVVHGIPSNRKIKDGDVVSIDIGVELHGYHSDAARTYIVGSAPENIQNLVRNTQEALYKGLSKIKEGAKIGDIGAAVEEYAHSCGLSVVEDLVGHGVGTNIHEDPEVPNYGVAGTGIRLKAGMVIAVEPMINLGVKDVYVDESEWTVHTEDGMPSAHFEHTVVVTKDGYKILTGEINEEE